jgi:hypothetical protein
VNNDYQYSPPRKAKQGPAVELDAVKLMEMATLHEVMNPPKEPKPKAAKRPKTVRK